MHRTRNEHLIDEIEIAGGVLKTVGDLKKILATDVNGEWGSITTTALPGNGGRDYHADYMATGIGDVLLWSLNSLGLPNPGMDYVEKHALELISAFRAKDRHLVVNVSGECVTDLVSLAHRAASCGFSRITLNGACPNRAGHGLICQDQSATVELFEALDDGKKTFEGITFTWKVALGMERRVLSMNVGAVMTSSVVDGIIVGNTIGGSSHGRQDGRSALSTSNQLTAGGLAGPVVLGQCLEDALFAASLLNVYPHHKFVIACGGISSAAHVYAALKLGAVGVQLNTAYREANEDPNFITAMKVDLHDLRHP